MWFSRIEADFFEDSASFNEIGLRGCFAKPMNGDHFIFFGIIRSNSEKIVSFGFLKFNVGYIVFPWLYFKS